MFLLCEDVETGAGEGKTRARGRDDDHAKAELTRASIPANYHFSAGRSLSNRADVYRLSERPSRPS